MKAKGSELTAFYKAWPIGPDFYHEDGMVTEDGDLDVEPNEEYDVEEALGYLAWQGRGDCPLSIEVNGVTIKIPRDWAGPSAVDVFKAWRGGTRAYSVILKAEQVEKFKAVCSEHGWEVV